MAREPEGRKFLGSQKWLQILVNDHPDSANQKLAEALRLSPGECVNWRSPLNADDYAEYSDGDAFTLLGVDLNKTPLDRFWPPRGPFWDALAVAGRSPRKPIIVEAKSHLCEFCSTKCGAQGQSLDLITASLNQTRAFLESKTRINWLKSYYQYANRLAHLYFLRELNKLDAYVLFIYFLNDEEMGGPRTIDEWRTVIELAERSLGVHGHPFLEYAPAVFIDVRDLRGT